MSHLKLFLFFRTFPLRCVTKWTHPSNFFYRDTSAAIFFPAGFAQLKVVSRFTVWPSHSWPTSTYSRYSNCPKSLVMLLLSWWECLEIPIHTDCCSFSDDIFCFWSSLSAWSFLVDVDMRTGLGSRWAAGWEAAAPCRQLSPGTLGGGTLPDFTGGPDCI